MRSIYRQFTWLLLLGWFALPAQAIETKTENRRDTIRPKLKRIIFDDKSYPLEYTLEGDSVKRILNFRNLAKDIPLKKYKKAIRKVGRGAPWNALLVLLLTLVIPLGLIIGLFSFAFLSSLKLGARLAMLLLLSLGAISIGGVSISIGFEIMKPETDDEGFLKRIIKEYNKEVDAQK